MNPNEAYCPKCHRVVAAVRKGSTLRCPECGMTSGENSDANEPNATLTRIAKIFAWMMIIVTAIATVYAAVRFAGCVAELRQL